MGGEVLQFTKRKAIHSIAFQFYFTYVSSIL